MSLGRRRDTLESVLRLHPTDHRHMATTNQKKRAARSRGVVPRVSAAIFGGFVATLQRLDEGAAYALGERLAGLMFRFLPSRRRVAQKNLRIAFGERGAPAGWSRRGLLRACYRNLGRTLTEIARFPLLTPERLRDRLKFEGLEHFLEAQEEGRGILALSAHYGNFELIAGAMNLLDLLDSSILVRGMRNAYMEERYDALRLSVEVETISKENSFFEMTRRLRRRQGIGFVLDQSMKRKRGIFVDFFGRPASTSPGLALLARVSRAPVVPMFIVREGQRRHRLRFLPVIPYERLRDRKEEVFRNTQRYTHVIEQVVREHPEQWMWIHDRWGRQPRPWVPEEQAVLDQLRRRRRGNSGNGGNDGR